MGTSTKFPNTLEGFGYKFNEEGKLRNIQNGKPFQFIVKEGDDSYNQSHYEALGEVISTEVYSLLENRCKLKKLSVPIDPNENESSTFIFASDEYDKADKLLVLIHGTGVVRAGQWARRLIINDCLDSGTQIPYIERAKELGYGILVLNTNDNRRNDDVIRGSESAEKHGRYTWSHYVQNTQASKIGIVAHSYGGIVTLSLHSKFKEEFEKRVAAVAFTDSVHFLRSSDEYLMNVCKNWVTSSHPLNTPINRRNDIPCLSAGCGQHEMTSWSSIDAIFDFIKSKFC